MEKDIFNLSSDVINRLEQMASNVDLSEDDVPEYYGCLCCNHSGICIIGITPDVF